MPELLEGLVVLGFDPLIVKGDPGTPGAEGDTSAATAAAQAAAVSAAQAVTILSQGLTNATNGFIAKPSDATGVLTRGGDGGIQWLTPGQETLVDNNGDGTYTLASTGLSGNGDGTYTLTTA